MYQGDDALAGLLAKHPGTRPVAEVKALVRGVAAAALDAGDDGWLALVSAQPSPALAAQLKSLKAALDQPSALPPPAERLARLRAELKRRGLAGLIVPRADEHQGEYVPGRARRLAWLTGFTGSAGLAAVLPDAAAVFVDGRYTLQVRAEVDTGLFTPRHLTEQPATDWLAETAKRGERVGLDSRVHTVEQVERFREALAKAGAELGELDDNPIDAVWTDQPPPPLGPVGPHAVAYTGRDAADKRADIAKAVADQGAAAAVLSAPDSIAWLLNIRGSDVPHTPLPLSHAILRADQSVELFVDSRKLLPGTREHLGNRVTVRSPEQFAEALAALRGSAVLVDPAQTSAFVTRRLTEAGARLVKAADPCQLPKACKNPVELEGTRRAHRRDGVAVTRFLAWLAIEAPKGGLTEIAASDRLEAFRREGERFRDLSFPSISGAGANGAIVHYRASPETERPLTAGELYLIDSGAQYLDGTTDITRTVAIGTPDAEQRDRFTRVLKGHIALATVRFPAGTTGAQLDVLARLPLWQAGLDYDHGTGHGVGSYLSVHEGPQRISKLPNTVALKPGMILSDEPGYYKTGAYGIRVENLVVVTELQVPGAERPMLGFETLTLAPIDRALVEPALMSADEIAWLDAYHARVRESLRDQLDPATAAWLDAATRPIGVVR